MMRDQDTESVGYTDMRLFRDWIQKAPPMLQALAARYPPSVYRLKLPDGDVVRVFPQQYYWNEMGEMLMAVIAPPELNSHHPHMKPIRITDVEPGKLEPIKWPPDAPVH